jgi:DNA-directed RNA polymerase subunit RPC12/RpoP
MAVDDPKFSCAACGKEYRWKPELAGRKAKCACGAAIVVPAERPAAGPAPAPLKPPAAPPVAPPAARAVPAPDAALPPPAPPPTPAPEVKPSPGAACPSCGAPLAANAVLCVNCGYNLKTGKTLSAVVVERDEEDEPGDAPPAKAAPAVKQAKKPGP